MPQRDRLAVPEGSEIKAIFGGTVTYVGLLEQDGQLESTNIILHNPETKQGASYLLPDNAQVQVAQNQTVSDGQVLARLAPGGQNLDCLAGANVAVTYLVDGVIVPVGERQYR